MSAREWKPGDVARDPEYDKGSVAFVIEYGKFRCPPNHKDYRQHIHYSDGDWNAGADALARLRPVAIIDPEDREQVERLLRATAEHKKLLTTRTFLGPLVDDVKALQSALREFANPTPPKPEVYEHLVYQQRGKTVEAVCGKLWIPDPEVTIVGRCESCREIAGRWVA